jgi:acyl-coenzyme A synthetase/AMP-(fatty) acid ligase
MTEKKIEDAIPTSAKLLESGVLQKPREVRGGVWRTAVVSLRASLAPRQRDQVRHSRF